MLARKIFAAVDALPCCGRTDLPWKHLADHSSSYLLNSIVMLHSSVWILAFAYLVGSFPTGYLLVRLFLKQDIRTMGSGSTGTTNVIRTGAKGLGAATFVLDILKGSLAVWAAIWLIPHLLPNADPLITQPLILLAALFCVIGHVFPVWLGFKGGKGVATSFGVFLVICPLAATVGFALFAATIAITRYVSLGSIVGAAAFPLLAWVWAPAVRSPLAFAILCAIPVLLILKHHQNIGRLINGTESRFGAKRSA